LHEFGHAAVAYLGGDKSVKDKGYLTLNPLKYTDASMTLVVPLIILMLGGIALPGAAVYIDHSKLRNRFWDSLVSLAGPLGTLFTLLLVAAPFTLNMWTDTGSWLYYSFALLALLEAVAFLLNMLPIPPMDGFGIIRPWLPSGIRAAANNFGRYGIWIVFAALWFIRPLNELLWGTAYIMLAVLNVSPEAADLGFKTFRQQSFVLMAIVFIALIIARRNQPAR
jgi:Zn-dependent protease